MTKESEQESLNGEKLLKADDEIVDRLFEKITQHPHIKQVGAALQAAKAPYQLQINGLVASAPAVLATALRRENPLLLVADSEERAGYLYSDLSQIEGVTSLYFYPSAFRRHIKYGHPDEAGEVMRTELIAALTAGEKPLIVTYPAALAEKIPDKEIVAERLFSVEKGGQLDLSALHQYLYDCDFTVTDYVYAPGEVAFRGSIVDIFAFNSEHPYRIDLFDEQVESIRLFSVASQLSIKEVERVTIAPNVSTLDAHGGQSLFRLAGGDYTVLFYDYDLCVRELKAIDDEEAVVVEGEGFKATSEMRLRLLSVEALLQDGAVLKQLHLSPSERIGKMPKFFFHTLPQPIFHKNFDLLIEGLERYRERNYELFFLTQNQPQADRLAEILRERGREDLIPAMLPVTLHEGFEDDGAKIALITDHQLFERYHKYRIGAQRVRSGAASLSLKELKSFSPGDYIVHYDHGIGQFAGLFKTQTGDVEQEVIKIIYRGGDYIYVNLHSLHKLSKYRAKDDEAPELSKLGSGAWERLKERTKKKVKDMARDLIRLYAVRKESRGFAFSIDSYLQHELEAAFMYEETPDQLKAMEAVKADMESPRPMDRLICGDVGFGKTEVAIRAAFKAVADSKQAAIMVPTTILAYQHYHTFKERLKGFPARIEYLSRAHNAKKTKQLLADLAEGKVDIVIGTHRLVSKDVVFKDLGLLIIDEEQKFGVGAKEKLRSLQVNVDTLTMSATPIPRTLQFSLMGTRDLSNIMTPPRNRYPIATEQIRFSSEIIREAINYELSRNGQIYFVHNRINDIEEVARTLQELVPDARIAVGHGRLNQTELEELILNFSLHEYDILVATTIIENGIDVSNANTMFIDEAYRYGLSDLHQLRGRVGRSNRKAFCYLITPPTDTLSDTARRRLRTLETFSDLGSGMRIALQDLDIRGAGNIFGREQSGFIADLGFDAYHRLFDEAVREVKREEFATLFENNEKEELDSVDTLFESDLMLSFPPSYVPGDAERIELYRELDGMEDKAELEAFEVKMIDRFGAIPPEGRQLIAVPLLRALGRNLGIPKIVLRGGQMRFFLPNDDKAPFYQSPSFGKILSYVAIHASYSHIEENRRGTRLIRFEHVSDVFEAVSILEAIANWQLAL